MAWSTADIPDQSGRVSVVTGTNGGLGLETALAIAAAGGHVVMAARNQEKASAAVERIRSEVADASLEVVPLDLGDQASVKAAAATIAAAHPKVDILVNNAGLMAMPERATADGYEMQFGVNHLGHWTFTSGLLLSLLAADAARVVTVTSVARFSSGRVNPSNPHLRDRYKPWRAYGQAKLANYDFGLGLQQQFEEAGVSAASLIAHPGFTNTDLQSHTAAEGGGGIWGPIFDKLADVAGMSAAQGATMQLRAATDPRAKGGELYAPRFAGFGAAVRRPVLRPGGEKAIATLWEVSERETGVALDVSEHT